MSQDLAVLWFQAEAHRRAWLAETHEKVLAKIAADGHTYTGRRVQRGNLIVWHTKDHLVDASEVVVPLPDGGRGISGEERRWLPS